MGRNKTRIAYRSDENKNMLGRMWHYKNPLTEIRQRCSISTFDIISCIDAFINCGEDVSVHFPNPQFVSKKVFESKAICDARDTYDEETAKKVLDIKLNMKYHKALAIKYEKIAKTLYKAALEIAGLSAEHNSISEECLYSYKKTLEE